MTVTTWNPSDKNVGCTLSNGNLTAVGNGSGTGNTLAARATSSLNSGMIYVEAQSDNLGGGLGFNQIGLANSSASFSNTMGSDTNSLSWNMNSGDVQYNNGVIQSGIPLNTAFTDICQMAIDFTNKKLWCRTNTNNWNGSATANPALNLGGTDISALLTGQQLFLSFGVNTLEGQGVTMNFGASAFTESVPVGFNSWNTGGGGGGSSKLFGQGFKWWW